MTNIRSRALAAAMLLAVTGGLVLQVPALAENSDPPRKGSGITGKSVAAGLLSFFIWPGIGQAVNDDRGRKVGTHAVLGLLPPYRFWSGYDALVDRDGGYWDGRI